MKFSNYLKKEVQSVGEWAGSQQETKRMVEEANGNVQKLASAYSKLALGFYGYELEY